MQKSNVENTAILLLGSNVGDRLVYLREAIFLLEEFDCRVARVSSIYESESWGFNSEWFLNFAAEIFTTLTPIELLSVIQEIEKKNGRLKKTTNTYEARTLDIDIIFFNDEIIKTESLSIPHNKMHLRRFVLEPLNDIIPNYIHPFLQKSNNELLENCTDHSRVRFFNNILKYPNK